MTLHIDLETRSTVDLRKTGTYVYGESPTTDIWCAAYAVDDGPVHLWTPDQPCPDLIFDVVTSSDTLVAHNAAFERVMWHHILTPRYGWPEPALDQWRCTMAMAYAMSLPGSLEQAAAAVGIEAEKDMVGHRTMMQMAKPRRVNDDGSAVWWDDEHRKQRLYAYCKQDVEVERQIEKRLMPLRPHEQRIWQLDQRINDRGVYVDQQLCRQAKKIVEATIKRLDREMRSATGGAVASCSAVQQLLAWLREQGISTDSVDKNSLTELLDREDLSPAVRKALELRQEGSKTSTAKIDTLLAGTSADGRARGLLQYHAAGTGRWAGRRFQPQNLPRPSREDPGYIDEAVEVLLTGDPDTAAMFYDRPLTVVSDCIRSMVSAAPGNRIMAADFAAIEARVIAWLAGQHDVLDVFRDHGLIYEHTAAGIFGHSVNKKEHPEKRQIGKVAVLALGYQGGVGAFQAMARGYGLQIGEHYDTIISLAPTERYEKAVEAFDQRGKTSGMTKETWVAAELVKLGFREANKAIVQFWYDLENAAIDAVADPGRITQAGYIRYRKAGSFLWCQLPSGRCICYPYAKLVEKQTPWGSTQQAIAYKSVNQMTRKWEWKDGYGGLFSENVTQGVARDVMAEAMERVDAAGYPVVLTVHDELVCEVPEGVGSLAEFEGLMTALPSWAEGLPIDADGWEGIRYRK